MSPLVLKGLRLCSVFPKLSSLLVCYPSAITPPPSTPLHCTLTTWFLTLSLPEFAGRQTEGKKSGTFFEGEKKKNACPFDRIQFRASLFNEDDCVQVVLIFQKYFLSLFFIGLFFFFGLLLFWVRFVLLMFVFFLLEYLATSAKVFFFFFRSCLPRKSVLLSR